jgi:hypothetical protein
MSQLSRAFGHIRHNVVAYMALFFALGTGGAYAANTIRSSDIVDNEVYSADVRNDGLSGGGLAAQDLGPGSVRTSEVQDGSLTGFDVKDGMIGQVDLADGTVNSAKVADNSLTGADINESTLNLPPTTTATFAGATEGPVGADGFTKVASKNLPAGSYAVTATVNLNSVFPFGGADLDRDTECELRNGTGFIGGAKDRRRTHSGDHTVMSLSMNGGAQVPAAGGEVSTWCRYQGSNSVGVVSGQMMIIRVAGFF